MGLSAVRDQADRPSGRRRPGCLPGFDKALQVPPRFWCYLPGKETTRRPARDLGSSSNSSPSFICTSDRVTQTELLRKRGPSHPSGETTCVPVSMRRGWAGDGEGALALTPLGGQLTSGRAARAGPSRFALTW
jgi:hypothetical protein